MPKNRYTFEKLEKHSDGLHFTAKRISSERRKAASNSIGFLGEVFESVEKLPKSRLRNTRLMLIARFLNHLFSSFLLIERGLFIDAYNPARSATETTLFYWAVCLDPTFAGQYELDQSPRPIEVRKTLERLGIDVEEVRLIYSHQSEVVHVGNNFEKLQIDWTETNHGEISVGGRWDQDLQDKAFNGIVAQFVLFLKYDLDYEVREPYQM